MTIEIAGAPAAIDAFLAALVDQRPPLARIDELCVTDCPAPDPASHRRFVIARSVANNARLTAQVPADAAPCAACVAELLDPANRRYRHPFINCTDCGPRYTIVLGLPYDRATTTMKGFEMCAACRREYEDPSNRRFHAEPICCPTCGPRLWLRDATGTMVWRREAALDVAVRLLRHGRIVAVKGVGGYHLACLAKDERAVARLRERKHREDKPFAVLVRDAGAARQLCEVNAVEERALLGAEAPIVLLPSRPGSGLATAVAPGSDYLGVFLPPSPLHLLLVEDLGEPLVLTSGNISDEPIAIDDADAQGRLLDRTNAIADAVLGHDRAIARRAEDSVVRVDRGRATVLRRGRGFAPRPITLPAVPPSGEGAILAVGAELKSTVCATRGGVAVLSPHLGDLENRQAYDSFRAAISDLSSLLGVEPGLVVHDLHPEYLSTKWALDSGRPVLAVQHHHAHIASCLAEHRRLGPVIGFAFDGLGYGDDGTFWGGEVLIADLHGYRRVAHLTPVPLPGGTSAIRQPWRMAAMHVPAQHWSRLAVWERNSARWDEVVGLGRSRLSRPTTSMGRLFDAVAALLDVRDSVTYEGQAAVELERLAQQGDRGEDMATFGVRRDGETLMVDPAPVLDALVEGLLRRAGRARLALGFHEAVARMVVALARELRAGGAPGVVALSGGVFQSRLLTGLCTQGLAGAGFEVLTHALVPPNDGGISIGQAVIGAARHEGRSPSHDRDR